MSESWTKYPHLERLENEDVEGILMEPEIWVEPKIDGANASLCMVNGVIRPHKRSGAVKGTDKGFRGWEKYLAENYEKYLAFFEKYPNTIIYGEWLVKHTIGYYRDSAWQKFYAYDILDLDTNHFIRPDRRIEMLSEFDLVLVPPIAKIPGPMVTEQHEQRLEQMVNNNRFLIDDTQHVGEGVVVKAFHGDIPYTNKYGRTTWAKIVRQEFKEQHTVAMGVNELALKKQWEVVFAEEFVTAGRVEKIKQKIMTEKGTGWKSQYIAEILGRVYHDVFTEELWSFVSKNKVKKIDFKGLQAACLSKTKQHLGI